MPNTAPKTDSKTGGAVGYKGEDWRKTSLLDRQEVALRDNLFTDVCFIVGTEKKRISAIKSILSLGSSVFAIMLSERWSSDGNEIVVPDVEPDAFYELLRFIYCEKVNLRKEVVWPLLYAADKYDVEALKKKCVDFLKNSLTASNVCFYLMKARLLGVTDLINLCFEILSRAATTAIFHCPHNDEFNFCFHDLDIQTICCILEKDNLAIEEVALFKSILGNKMGRKIFKHSKRDTWSGSFTVEIPDTCKSSIKSSGPIIETDRQSYRQRRQKGFEGILLVEEGGGNGHMRWAKLECRGQNLDANIRNMRRVLEPALPLIRFRLMSPKEFTEIVSNSSILSIEEELSILTYLTSKPRPENLRPIPRFQKPIKILIYDEKLRETFYVHINCSDTVAELRKNIKDRAVRRDDVTRHGTLFQNSPGRQLYSADACFPSAQNIVGHRSIFDSHPRVLAATGTGATTNTDILKHENVCLENSRPLSDYGIENESIILLQPPQSQQMRLTSQRTLQNEKTELKPCNKI